MQAAHASKAGLTSMCDIGRRLVHCSKHVSCCRLTRVVVYTTILVLILIICMVQVIQCFTQCLLNCGILCNTNRSRMYNSARRKLPLLQDICRATSKCTAFTCSCSAGRRRQQQLLTSHYEPAWGCRVHYNAHVPAPA
jgi:hypothetical protein